MKFFFLILAFLDYFPNNLNDCRINYQYESWIDYGNILCINGIISRGTLYAFEEDMIPKDIDYVILNSQGGTWAGGLEISELIENNDITVIVPNWARCSSNCVMLLSSSPNAIVLEDANINVHFVYIIDEDYIYVDFHLSKQYFEQIGNVHLYNDYIDFLIYNNLVTYNEIENQSIIRHISENWPMLSLMNIPVDMLNYYGIVEGEVYD